MANQGYCMFQNTYEDLQQCYRNWNFDEEDKISKSEEQYQKQIVKLCQQILNLYDEEELQEILNK